jgi:hypothetical protein
MTDHDSKLSNIKSIIDNYPGVKSYHSERDRDKIMDVFDNAIVMFPNDTVCIISTNERYFIKIEFNK